MGEFEKLGFDVEVKDADSAVKHLEAIAAALERIQNATKGGIKSKSITDALGGGKKGSSSSKPSDDKNWQKQTKSLGAYLAKMSSAVVLAKKLAHFMSGAIQESANYVENLNLFAVAYGETYKETIDWALNISKAYGLANNEIVKFAGTFRQLSTSLGIVGDTATSVSKTVTELGYDLSALFNTSVENAMEKLQSSIFSGNVRPLRAYGIDISQNQIDALFETSDALASLGVNSRNLSQSDKVLARLIITLRDGSNAFGTMSREINTLQSQIRIFQGSLSNFKLAVGDLIAEPLRNALVFVNAFIIAITNLIRVFKPLQKTDENNVISGVAESAETAIEEIEQLNGKLAGFDKFNTLQTGSGDGGASNVTSALTEELAKQQAKYAETQEAMRGIKNEAVELANTLTNLMPILAGIGVLLAKAFIDKKGGIATLTANSKLLSKALSPMGLTVMAIAAAFVYFYNTNDYFKDSITKLLEAVSSLVSNALEPMLLSIKAAMPIIIKLAQGFGYALGFIINLVSWIINFVDKIGVLKGAVTGLVIAFIALKTIQIGKFFVDMYKGAVALVKVFPMLIMGVKAYGKEIGGNIIKKMKTFISGLKESKAAATGLAFLGIGMLVTIIQQLIGNWDNLSGLQKVVGIFGAIGAAALAAAAAIAAFQGSWTLGTAAVAIVGALAAIAGAFATFKKDTQIKGFADGGYSNANLIMTHENGKREWVGKAAGSSAIVNDTQMSDIMRSAVGQGVFDALKANSAISGSGKTGNETIVVKIGEEAVFNAVRKTAKKRGAGFAGI